MFFYKAGQNSTGIKVIIGSQVTKIPAYLFNPYYDASYAPKITSVEFEEESVCSSIGDYAFCNCNALTSADIPNSVTIIGDSAFKNCTALTSVNIPDSVSNIGSASFRNCTSLISVIISDSTTTSKVISNYAFCDCTSLTSMIIGNSTTTIGSSAFRNCSNLISVTIPDSVTTIEQNAFYNCSRLSSIRFPDSLTFVGSSSFSNTSWYNNQPDGLVYVGRVAYKYKGKCPATITIKEDTLSVSDSAFYYCTSLTIAIIPNSVISIGKFAFSNCFSLQSIIIGCSVKTIDKESFYNCTALKNITFSGNAPIFGDECFYATKAIAYYPTNDPTWTEDVRQNYGGQLTWIANEDDIEASGFVGNVSTSYTNVSTAIANSDWVKLHKNITINVALTKNLYIDLNGYNLTGTIITNGYHIYGMDSTTDDYICDNTGNFNCVDENGDSIIPILKFKSDITGSTKRYMSIKTEDGYTFHRFYMGITKVSLAPNVTGFGYKAEFDGDEMVQKQIASVGYNLWLTEEHIVNCSVDGFRNGITLRIQNFDVLNYGEVPVNANVIIKLANGAIIESSVTSMSMRTMLEEINTNYNQLTSAQASAVKAMIERHPTMSTWNIANLLQPADVLIINNTQTISNTTINSDVYISSTGIVTFNNVTINGNIYCYGQLTCSSVTATNVYAYQYGSMLSCDAYDGTHGKVSGGITCDTLYIKDDALDYAFEKWGKC